MDCFWLARSPNFFSDDPSTWVGVQFFSHVATVFPGGKLDPEDSTRELYSYCEGMTDAEYLEK